VGDARKRIQRARYGALPHRPTFPSGFTSDQIGGIMGACPISPAAGFASARIAGTSCMATYMLARSRAASVSLRSKTVGLDLRFPAQ